ncbi:hypothetical protein V1264_016573 [Littorina saxatilis]|uniref:Ig-like domain-containing protein n=1 Tax=Littorina saxatilis TaxID=31220 RepID=A0AAN9BHT7_9CAEN
MIATQLLGVFIPSFIVLIESQVCPRHNTWSCSNGGCIWIDWRCDGEAHCDGSDEQNCADWNCSLSWWKCGNDMQCIWKLDRCDGDVDCADGSDEKNCENWPCGQTWWKCGDRTLCIPRRFRCDGTTQCDDGSDEQHCDTAVVTSLTLDGHSDTITVDGDDHRTLNLTCRVFGRVKGLVTIQKESDVFGNVTFRSNNINYRRLGTYTYDAVMTLTDVTCGDTGRYICAVSQGISGIGSKSIQLNVACAGIKYGGKLTCPGAWKIGQDVKLTLTLDRSIWPSICRTDPDRREARFEVIKWSDPGRQSIMCTVVNITSPGACQGNFTPGTIGCGCVNKTDEHFTLELNFVMDSTSIGNWSADTLCLRIDSSKQLQLHVAPECNVRLDDVVLTCPQEWVLNASVTLYCEVKKSSITAKCDTAPNVTFFKQNGADYRCTVGSADYNTCSFDNTSSTSCGCRQNATHYTFVYHISEVGEADGGDWECDKACSPSYGVESPLTTYINPACTRVNVTDARTGARRRQVKSEDGNSVTITLGVVTALGVVVAMVVGAVLAFWYYHRKVKAEARGQSDQAGPGAIDAGAFRDVDAATTPDESTAATWQSDDTQASSLLFDNSSVSDESSVADASDSTVDGSNADNELP